MRYFIVLFCTRSLKSGVYTCFTFQFGAATNRVLSGHMCLVATVIDSLAVDCELYRQDWCSFWS